MKKITYIVATLLLLSISVNAQFKHSSKEKIKTLKIAYITEQLNLSETEAEKFWPLYNKYDEKMMSYRMNERLYLKKKILKLGGFDALTENDAKDITQKIIALDKNIYETKKSFFTKISEVLSHKKILRLEIAERNFHRKLLKKYRRKHKSRN